MASVDGVGAIVGGGDPQALGLGSLGRRGGRVCVVDDEPSISRSSRSLTIAERVADLHDELGAIQTLLDIGARFNLTGWVAVIRRWTVRRARCLEDRTVGLEPR